MPTPNFQPVRLLDPHCCYKFIYLMANSADPNQLASEEGSAGEGLKWPKKDFQINIFRISSQKKDVVTH